MSCSELALSVGQHSVACYGRYVRWRGEEQDKATLLRRAAGESPDFFDIIFDFFVLGVCFFDDRVVVLGVGVSHFAARS